MRKLSIIVLIFVTCLTLAPSALAAGGAATTGPGGAANTGGSPVTLINPLKGGATLQSFLISILDLAIRIGTIAIILMLIFIGYKFVVAQGAPTKIEEARRMLLWTVVGALILLGSKAISIGIEATVQALSAGT